MGKAEVLIPSLQGCWKTLQGAWPSVALCAAAMMGDGHDESAGADADDEAAFAIARLCESCFMTETVKLPKSVVTCSGKGVLRKEERPFSSRRNLCWYRMTIWGVVPRCPFTYQADRLGQPGHSRCITVSFVVTFDTYIFKVCRNKNKEQTAMLWAVMEFTLGQISGLVFRGKCLKKQMHCSGLSDTERDTVGAVE